MSRGYLNNSQLTQEKFIQNPFGKKSERLYGTGDLVKYHEDGNLEFLGRIDDQVKIRGYRVEVGEIENQIQKSQEVKHVTVQIKQEQEGNKRLVAYVIPQSNYDKESLLNKLKEELPEYMIPSAIVEMEEFPMLASGKVDRKALPDPEHQKSTTRKAPSDETENQTGSYMGREY